MDDGYFFMDGYLLQEIVEHLRSKGEWTHGLRDMASEGERAIVEKLVKSNKISLLRRAAMIYWAAPGDASFRTYKPMIRFINKHRETLRLLLDTEKGSL